MCQVSVAVDDAIDRALEHIHLGLADFRACFPYVSENLVYATSPQEELPWSAGFWPGQLHLADSVRPEAALMEGAAHAQQRLAAYLDERAGRLDHDAGFQYFLGAAVAARRTDDDAARAVALRAADILAGRFNEVGGFIRAHGWSDSSGIATPWAAGNDGPPGRFIADTLMTVPLLYWAYGASGEAQYLEVARAHVHTSVRHLARADGWLYHAFELEPDTGEPIGGTTLQGAHDDSAWARAQAWAIYGLALASHHLDEPDYATRAAELALRFFDNSLPSGLAPWDFVMPQGADTIPDASATAIAVSGALYLTRDSTVAETTRNEVRGKALKSLTSLVTEAAVTDARKGQQGLIEYSCYHYPAGRGLRESTAWGDYFYLEALVQASGGEGLYALA